MKRYLTTPEREAIRTVLKEKRGRYGAFAGMHGIGVGVLSHIVNGNNECPETLIPSIIAYSTVGSNSGLLKLLDQKIGTFPRVVINHRERKVEPAMTITDAWMIIYETKLREALNHNPDSAEEIFLGLSSLLDKYK